MNGNRSLIANRNSELDGASKISEGDSACRIRSGQIQNSSQPPLLANGRSTTIQIITDHQNTESPESSDSKSEDSKKIVALDGGWGWMCVVGCSFMHFLLGGFGRSFGIIYVYMLDRFECSAATGSAIGAVFTAIRMGCGPLVGILTNKLSVRIVTGVGAFCFTVGCLMCAFATSPAYMFVSYSVISGLGGAMVYFPAVVIVGQYFDKRRGVAMGLSTAGSGLGCIAIPPLYHLTFSVYGYRGAFFIATGLVLNFFVCAVLYRPLASSWRGINVAVRRKLRLEANDLQEPAILIENEESTDEPEDPLANGAVDIPKVTTSNTHLRHSYGSIESLEALQRRRSHVQNGMHGRSESFDPRETRSSCDEIGVSCGSSNQELRESIVRRGLRIEDFILPEFSSPSNALNAEESIVKEFIINEDHFNEITEKPIDEIENFYNKDQNSSSENMTTDSSDATTSDESSHTSKDKLPECAQPNGICHKLNSYFGVTLLLSPAFSCFIVALGLGTMAYIGAQNLIVAHANEMGVDSNMSVYILSAIGAADTTGRVLSGVLFDVPIIRRWRKFMFTFILLGSGLSIIGWGFCRNFAQFIGLSLANGAFNGALVTGRPIVVADIVGIKNMTQAFGLTVFCQGVFIGIGPYIAGHLRDISGTYLMSFIFTGSCSCFAALLYLIGNRIGRRSKCC